MNVNQVQKAYVNLFFLSSKVEKTETAKYHHNGKAVMQDKVGVYCFAIDSGRTP